MGILKRSETIEILSRIRNIKKENVILYNEDEFELYELLLRDENALIIQHWWKNKLDEIYMEGFDEDEFPQDITEWLCWGCGENDINCECLYSL